MVGDVIRRGFIGEAKNTEFIGKLPELCNTVGLFNVDVKYMGGMEVMVIVETEETVKNVIENTEHGVRSWLWKIRRANALSRSNGRLTWLSNIGVPISCWKECDTLEPKLISEEVLVRIGGNRCKVLVKEEIRDIVQFKIEDSVGKPMEEDEVLVDDTMELGGNMVNDDEPAESEPFDDEEDGEDDEEVVEQTTEMGGSDGEADREEKKEDQESVVHFSRKVNDEKSEQEDIEIDSTPSKVIEIYKRQGILADLLSKEKFVDIEDVTRVKECMRSGLEGKEEAQSIMNLEKRSDKLNKDIGHILEERGLLYANNKKKDEPSNEIELLKCECKDLHASDSSPGANLDKGKQQALNDSVCSFNNVMKIGEQIGALEKSQVVVSDIMVNGLGGWGWCLFGDFNEVREPGGRKYTRISDDGFKFSKLDRFLVSTEFLSKWDNLSVVTLERKLSDHCPIALKDMDLDFGPKPFKAFDFWLEDGEIDNVFKAAWEKHVQTSRPDCMVRDRFKNVKEDLKV
ncbi:RNA-directed DNA polymerase, eukaryota [Tanacetum coccineum]